jgi:hypothetical protein
MLRASCFFLGLSSLLGFSVLPMSISRGVEIADNSDITESKIFWTQAQQLSTDRLIIIDGITEAIAARDPSLLPSLRESLAYNLNSTQQFLNLRTTNPNLVCSSFISPLENPAAIETGFDPDQLWVYCTLYLSNGRLTSVLEWLDQQIFLSGQPIFGLPLGQLELPAIGIPLKPPFSAFPLPLPRPIAPVPIDEFTSPLESAKDLLTRSLELFPPDFPVTLPEGDRFEVYPEATHAEFLAQPNTGIVRILPNVVYDPYAHPAGIAPPLATRVPFTPLVEPEAEGKFVDRLALQVVNGNFQMVLPGVSYGFMADLGDVAIEDIDPNLTNISTFSPDLKTFFLNYEPPQKFTEIQEDRQRFILNKLENFELSDPLFLQLPAQVNRTYLLRSIQFHLPEIVVTGRPITQRDRRILALLLETPSSDLLVAFRPISRRSDGSYIVLWSVLQQFRDPEIIDLFKYVNAPDL